MRLISCIALLMVIPAVGLLTKANKFTDEKRSETPVHEHIVNDSASFKLFSHFGTAARFEGAPVVFATDYRQSFFKPIYLHSAPLFTINKIK
ncbi:MULTISPECIES: hypothetical protein [unclassified Pedobacter]|uniref:hypothetical protein n=1 Tax=unclassified Pedobacter TaxID=2628915 RepID=UPI0014229A23|nr:MULTISPECIES: hypothetical protein [unclassified Pedobacter]NII83045.1 hypothetical protein [Pedobacter sp. SG908]NMN37063.1 hypothetical protein [Pedobacter sp. SG918]